MMRNTIRSNESPLVYKMLYIVAGSITFGSALRRLDEQGRKRCFGRESVIDRKQPLEVGD